MANTYSQIYIQAIFAVRERASLIRNDWKEELFKYIVGIFRNKNQKLIAIGGVEDHIHLLFGLRPSMAISDLIRDVKADSTVFINEKRFAPRKFYRQVLALSRIRDHISTLWRSMYSTKRSTTPNSRSRTST